ncbi:MAG TPA: Hpt domain-containing protein, partial [Kofleriaceae bacterium]|nr:Hpt domain-containing protein [Kofleriaceae bacterium]
METGFTIDDVRETLTRDVTRPLGRIERAAREILDDRELALNGEPTSLPRLVAIGEQSHAIYGTSRLVSAQSLADSSARMETLAQHGREQLARAMRHLAVVREIAEAMVGGSTDMLEMLSLELDGKPREAQTIADNWRLRVDDVLQNSSIIVSGAESANSNLRVVGPPTVDLHGRRSSAALGGSVSEPAAPAQAVDHGWSEIQDGPPSVAMARAAGTPIPPSVAGAYSFASSMVELEGDTSVIDPDLAEVFAEEASSTLSMLDGALAALRANPGDRALLKSIERGFHTLKGAAATVGLEQVSAHAADLQDRAEQLADEGRPVLREEADALIHDAAALRRLAGIPVPAPLPVEEPSLAPAPAPEPSRGFDEVVAEFERDAGVTLDEAEHLVRDLRDADPASALLLARDLGAAMHRLRGSALVAGFDALAEIAAGIEALLEASPIDAARIADEVARASALLAGRPAAPRAPTPSEPEVQRVPVPVPDAEIDPSFQQECADLLESLDRAALALERSDRPADQIGDLLRSYHTLKGVVNALGLWPIGDQLHKLEDLLESMTASSVLPPLRAITALLLPFHGELRRQLRTVAQGYVDVVPGRLESRFARMSSIASRQTSASSIAPSVPSRARSRGSRLGEGSEASEVAAAAAPDRRNLRVSIDRLDALMNLAGELVISRSRLLNRIDWLRGLQVDLGRSARHVVELVDKFRDDHEFSQIARGGGKDGVRWQGFSDLELDRYEDVNILARTLTEGSTDLHELFGQFAGGLGALADDSDSLGTIISGIQGEVTRT